MPDGSGFARLVGRAASGLASSTAMDLPRTRGCLWTTYSPMVVPAILERMAFCQLCDREMLTASSCTVAALHIGGKPFAVVPYGGETRYGRIVSTLRRCHDCGVEPNGFHHLGCDWAECPHCRGQLFTCSCPFDEFADERDDEDLEDWD